MTAVQPWWDTSCRDWERRIVNRESLVAFPPLFPEQAEAAYEVFGNLMLTRVPGRPKLKDVSRPWITDFVKAIFGSYDPDTGRRLIRHFFLLVGKKNGKSPTAAAVMLTALLRNWREYGQFIILAPTKEVASNSYEPAMEMVKADPRLDKILHCQNNTRSITHLKTGAVLKVVAADSETLAGKGAIGVFIDELWLFGKRANAGSMLREATGGLMVNPEGFVIYASTQSDKIPAGVFRERLKEFREIRDGVRVDPKSLGVLYEYPEHMLKSKAYTDPSTWYIPNPNLGASVDVETIQDEYRKAELDGDVAMNDFLAKHLNIEIGQGQRTDGWAGAKLWPRGIEKGVTLREILARCEVAAIGIDGGGLDDLLGIGVIGREKSTQRWLGWAHAFVTPEGMDRRKANQTQYEQFIKDGDLTVVERIGDDIVGVIDIVNQVMEAGILYKVGIDPAGIGGIIGALNEIGVYFDEDEADGLLESVKQGIGLMGAIKTVERRLVDGSFRHRGSAMMAWCAGNAIVNATATGMRISRDASGFGKIDPLMAIFNAAYLMQWNPESALSAYEDEDVMI